MAMLRLERSAHRWWQKPLARFDNRDLPAELVVLFRERGELEAGAWLNSRGITTGTVDLLRDESGKFKSVREALPAFVRSKLQNLYEENALSKGAPDLVLWNSTSGEVRFVEVKCPHWDRPSFSQIQFHRAAEASGCSVKIVEWEFHDFGAT
jgi:hypothetical protein